ncbi:hypothetical protein [Actinomadura sp. 3N407]
MGLGDAAEPVPTRHLWTLYRALATGPMRVDPGMPAAVQAEPGELEELA